MVSKLIIANEEAQNFKVTIPSYEQVSSDGSDIQES
jgi:hypothetical protein